MRRGASRSVALVVCVLAAVTGPGCRNPVPRDRPGSAPSSPARRDPPTSELDFRRLLLDRGIDVVHMTPAAGVGAFLDFYDASKYDVLPEGEVLRVTWNSHGTRPAVPAKAGTHTFVVYRDLTWTAGNADGRVERWALWLKFDFGQVERASVADGEGAHSCVGPRKREECEAFIRTLPLYRAVSTRSDGDVQIGFDPVQTR